MSIAVFLVVSLAMMLIVGSLLRCGKLREKYAILWLIIGALMLLLALVPSLLDWAARLVGVQVPANLLFALSIILLMGVGLHAARELTILEDETRTLAEEISILRSTVDQLSNESQNGTPRNTAESALERRISGEKE